VSIVTNDGHRWNVAPHFLERVEPSAVATPGNSNVIEISRKNKSPHK
jgi:hypothetical protein